MIQKQNNITNRRRIINSTTVRKMLYWGHYDFRKRMTDMSERFQHRHIHVVSERYTSKTCSGCGWIDHNLGSKETFKCNSLHAEDYLIVIGMHH